MTVERKRTERAAHATTVRRHLISIRKAHLTAGYDNPTSDLNVKRVWKGIPTERGVKAKGRKAALTADLLLEAERALDAIHAAAEANAADRKQPGAERAAQLLRLRDRALLLCGWSGALRRSEIARIDLEHLQREPRRLHVDCPSRKPTKKAMRDTC